FPDLAAISGTGVTILLNAADWGGDGHGAPPASRPGLHPAAYRQPPPALGFAVPAVSKSQALHPISLTAADLQTHAVQRLPMATDIRQLAHTEAISLPKPLFPDRHPQDAAFEQWGE